MLGYWHSRFPQLWLCSDFCYCLSLFLLVNAISPEGPESKPRQWPSPWLWRLVRFAVYLGMVLGPPSVGEVSKRNGSRRRKNVVLMCPGFLGYFSNSPLSGGAAPLPWASVAISTDKLTNKVFNLPTNLSRNHRICGGSEVGLVMSVSGWACSWHQKSIAMKCLANKNNNRPVDE